MNGNESHSREYILRELAEAGIQTRPIISGNFTQGEMIKYFKRSDAGPLGNAQAIQEDGYFVGNHHYNMIESIDKLVKVLSQFRE